MYNIIQHEHEYDIVVTGPIGAGKTTLVKKLINYFLNQQADLGVVPEYIDGMKNGPTKLADWLSGKITQEEFQDYLLDAYDYLNHKVYNQKIRLFERTPIEGAIIFSQGTNIYEKTLHGSAQLHDKYSIPDPQIEVPYIIDASQTIEEVFQAATKIIEEDRMTQTRKRIIYLRIDDETVYNRVNKRSRKGEDAYSKDYLSLIINRYETMFRL